MWKVNIVKVLIRERFGVEGSVENPEAIVWKANIVMRSRERFNGKGSAQNWKRKCLTNKCRRRFKLDKREAKGKDCETFRNQNHKVV